MKAFRIRRRFQNGFEILLDDCAILEYVSGVDLFALALLIATLSDWLATCQSTVPVVYFQCAYSQRPLLALVMHKRHVRSRKRRDRPEAREDRNVPRGPASAYQQ